MDDIATGNLASGRAPKSSMQSQKKRSVELRRHTFRFGILYAVVDGGDVGDSEDISRRSKILLKKL